MRCHIWSVLVFVSLFAMTPGCTSSPSLDGTWTATSARPQTLVPDVAVTLTFADGRVSGTAGCNRFMGAYSVSGGLLKAPQLASTMMFCAGPRGEQETWVMALLSSAPTVSVDGDTMVLTGATSTVTFRRS